MSSSIIEAITGPYRQQSNIRNVAYRDNVEPKGLCVGKLCLWNEYQREKEENIGPEIAQMGLINGIFFYSVQLLVNRI